MEATRHLEAEGANREHWNELAPVHARSYGTGPLLGGGHLLNKLQLDEVGDVAGRSLLHLQCHIGTDTLSWARLGAVVTGVDISERSIEEAEKLAGKTGLPARFIRSSVYDLRDHLEEGEGFDIVYTSIGVLCWLSDLEEWARIIHDCLSPGGFLYLYESHPFLSVFDDEADGLNVRDRYFHEAEPVRWPGQYHDYSDGNYVVQTPSWEWTWSIADILGAVIGSGLVLEFFHEHEEIHWRHLPAMRMDPDGMYRLPRGLRKLPLMFSLRARKSPGS